MPGTTSYDVEKPENGLAVFVIDGQKNQKNAQVPHVPVHDPPTISDIGALVHIIKSSLGGGMLGMAYAFKNAGLIFGLAASCCIGCLIIHTTAILIDSAHYLGKIYKKERLSYADIAEYAFIYGFKGRLKRHAYKARCIVNIFLFITYYGVLSVYMVIVASTCKHLFDRYFHYSINIRIYTALLLVIVLPIGLIRFLKYLVPFSTLANVSLFAAIGLIMSEVFKQLPPMSSRPAIVSPTKWPLFISAAFTSMEGVGVIMPLENEMQNPAHLTKAPYLLHIGLLLSVFLNIFVGFFGYLKYGSDIEGVISLNLPDDWLSDCVKITVVLVLLLTFGLQMTPVMQVVWDAIGPTVEQTKNGTLYYYLTRVVLIIGNVIIASILPSAAAIIGLVGALGFAVLGILGPSVIETTVRSNRGFGFMKWRLVKNLLIMILAAYTCVCGIQSSISELENVV